MTVSYERLREALSYCPDSGRFTWLVTMGRNVAGTTAGTWRADGYLRIQIDGVRMYASHWAWFYMTGDLPADEIDHEDRNRGNNAWSNLRPATKSQNCANRRRGRGGDLPRGVAKRGERFVAQIRACGKHTYLGIYPTAEAAHAAYCEARRIAFGDFAHNEPQEMQEAA